MAFSGFPRGVLSTPVPEPLLNSLLAEIEDLAELKVTLRGLWLTHQKKGALRAVSREEFLNDGVLLRGLQGVGSSPREAIEQGLERAVRRRTLLVFQPDPARPGYRLYALNTQGHRRALQQAVAGALVAGPGEGIGEAAIAPPTEDKPNIFALYENNIGTISPLLAEQLKEAEELYPGPWISDAFQISVTQNKRSWAYISTILRRWLEEGKDLGEPGGHSKADNRTEYLEEYQRRRGHLPWEPADR
jgi:DNA replication protein